MTAPFAGTLWIDAIIGLTVIEGGLLTLYFRATGRGVAPSQFAVNLISGLCLMLALRAALVGAGVEWIAACVAGAGLAHALDLRRRWRR